MIFRRGLRPCFYLPYWDTVERRYPLVIKSRKFGEARPVFGGVPQLRTSPLSNIWTGLANIWCVPHASAYLKIWGSVANIWCVPQVRATTVYLKFGRPGQQLRCAKLGTAPVYLKFGKVWPTFGVCPNLEVRTASVYLKFGEAWPTFAACPNLVTPVFI